jgi:outer membrane cobalamin receptor
MRPAVRGRHNEAGGFVISREDIERRHPMYLTSVLALAPGARVIRAPALGSRLLLRNDCQPIVIIDGVRLSQSEGLDRLVSPNNVESVEIYHGLNLPVEYGMHSCGGVVIWTRRGGTEEGFEPLGNFWTRALMAGGALILALLVIR